MLLEETVSFGASAYIVIISGGELIISYKDAEPVVPSLEFDDENVENWITLKLLRYAFSSYCVMISGHLQDIYDVCWSYDNEFVASGSIDNTILIWSVSRGVPIQRVVSHCHYVQGVFVIVVAVGIMFQVYHGIHWVCIWHHKVLILTYLYTREQHETRKIFLAVIYHSLRLK